MTATTFCNTFCDILRSMHRLAATPEGFACMVHRPTVGEHSPAIRDVIILLTPLPVRHDRNFGIN